MLKTDVIRLVKTLSATEKRYLKLSTKKQSGNRTYLGLFDIIDQTQFKDIELLEARFKEAYPNASFENTCKYLLKIVTDVLVLLKSEKDNNFQQMQCFMKAKILFDRSLINEGFKELRKVQNMASASQNHMMEYLTYREELNVLSSVNFPELQEAQLVELQMKGKLLLKTLQQVQEHNSLYGLLKYRLIYNGKSMTEHAKATLNDLLLSELSLVTNKVSHNFESKKLHLLFQSFFFTSIGDYRSALKTFSELNKLFESNLEKLENPPDDYLSSLEGILDSLRTVKLYSEMPFYLAKVSSLINEKNIGPFTQSAAKTVVTYTLNYMVGKGEYRQALEFLNSHDEMLLKETIISDYEKHGEMLFYIALTYFGLNEFDKAIKQINKIGFLSKSNHHFVIYKAAKLLGLLARYEIGDMDYLAYQVRAYKRVSRYKGENLQIEKLIFKVIGMDPNANSVVKNKLLLKKLTPSLDKIMNDKYELQVLKYFDLLSWIENKFSTSKTKLNYKAREKKIPAV